MAQPRISNSDGDKKRRIRNCHMKVKNADPILKELSETLKRELGRSIKDIILFGSRANVILSEPKP